MGTICPPQVGIGLTDLANIGGASGTSGNLGFNITVFMDVLYHKSGRTDYA